LCATPESYRSKRKSRIDQPDAGGQNTGMKPVLPLLTAVTLATPLRAGITRAEKPIRFGQRCTLIGHVLVASTPANLELALHYSEEHDDALLEQMWHEGKLFMTGCQFQKYLRM
jgi:hypothetical protein